MILVEIRDIPRDWWEDDDMEILHDLVGNTTLATLKDGYVTISETNDNLPLKYVRLLQDLDGDLTKSQIKEINLKNNT